jgi:hypothetical protein
MKPQPMPDDEENDTHLQDDDEAVDEGRFLRAADQQQRQQEQDEDRRDVHDAVRPAGRARKANATIGTGSQAEPFEDAVGVFAPRDGDGGGRRRRIRESNPSR